MLKFSKHFKSKIIKNYTFSDIFATFIDIDIKAANFLIWLLVSKIRRILGRESWCSL